MPVACRLAGLSALGAHYAGVKWRAMRGGHDVPRFFWTLRSGHAWSRTSRQNRLHCWASPTRVMETPGIFPDSSLAASLTVRPQER